MYLAVGAVAWGVKTTHIGVLGGWKGVGENNSIYPYLTLQLFKSIIDENEMKIENKTPLFHLAFLYFSSNTCLRRCLRQHIIKCTVHTYLVFLLYY